MNQNQSNFLAHIAQSIENQSFISLTLGNYNGEEPLLRQLIIRQIFLKNVPHLSFVYRYQNRDITKNLAIAPGLARINTLIDWSHFRASHLKTSSTNFDFSYLNAQKTRLKQLKNTVNKSAAQQHNSPKNYKISNTNKGYLKALQLADAQGNIYKNAQDKFRQINHFLDQLSPVFEKFDKSENISIADMGSGKGYLTFAIYDYLHSQAYQQLKVLGVEMRPDLVAFCNQTAQESQFTGLLFEENSIQTAQIASLDILIALHACDTATDDAIIKGIKAGAGAIVVAPCCHKQIRREMERSKTTNQATFITKYGTFLERQAEMLTDGMRCLILNYFGYKTKVLEFVSVDHTPKNVLIIAEKGKTNTNDQEKIKAQLTELKAFWGIGKHYLERIFLD